MRAFAVLALVCAPVAAHADDAKSEAKQHLERAKDFHAQKKYAESLDEMKTAYALDPQPELLYAIAQLHVQLGQCDRALPFYERFLSSKPKDGAAAKARQAIEICKTRPPPALVVPEPPVSEPKPDRRLAPEPVPSHTGRTRSVALPWYRDLVGDALLGTGVVASAVAVVQYVGARSDNDAAAAAGSYPSRLSLLESARDQRRIAVIAGGLGAALTIAGVLKFSLGSRKTETLIVAPGPGGGTVAWSRTF